MGDLVGDDIETIKYNNYSIDYHEADFSKKQIENFAKKCIKEGVKTRYQMDCCVRSKMYPEYI